jgi:hypothetical protein
MSVQHSPRADGTQETSTGAPQQIGFGPLDPRQADQPPATMNDILATLQTSAAASRADNQALRADNMALHAQMARLQQQVEANQGRYVLQGLRAYASVQDMPLVHSRSAFNAYTLKNLPVDIEALRTGPTPLLQTADNKFVKAIDMRKGGNFQANFRSPQVQDGITIALTKEITPLLTLEAIGELSADVHQALADASGEDSDPADFFAAVQTAAYLAAWSQKMVCARLGEIAAFMQFDHDTAQRWAAQSYGPQNTLMGDSPAAAAFQLVKAAEPKPAASATPAWAGKIGSKPSGGRGRGRAGGRAGGWSPPAAEQVSGPGASKAPGRAQ